MKAMFPPTPTLAFLGATDARLPMEEHFAGLSETWKNSIEKWTQLVNEGADPSSLRPEALRELFAPANWSGPATGAFDSALREVLEGPKYATLWNMDREVLELQRRAAERDKATRAFQTIVQRAWNTAYERFAKTMPLTRTETPATWRSLADRWIEVANETLIETHRSDEFVEAQSRMLRAASDYRLKERELAEAWCAACHIPTRTEMDEMQRAVTDLRRQVRLQRRRDPAPDGGAVARPKAQRPATSRSRRTTKA
ncbi:poly(R)-hydroxyalkanoic acid synthase subunit PhaE [Variovorax sp. J22R24]|uniref:poly(R)-hydroxyalkanoic acid synthase subunit PhaE n=1 Tax=Variovorax gracilis TaxID=3053502 RepID=UPI0025764E8D|nr:poly(R)-hydroxyalkanoic acid synthase subunit PhaE [Variovorax sp. J22R24]MDM0109179.1 poly(R)-hydroxyalkanoic acid synthase subunit PhaE [Variovorax sp. J22R24]